MTKSLSMDERVDPGDPGLLSLTAQAGALNCCTGFYELDWVRHLAEDCFHPGGEVLTRRTVSAMQLNAGASVLDVGCGVGGSARLLQREFALTVFGLDPGLENLVAAQASQFADSEHNDAALLIQGKAPCLPLKNAAVDGILAECTFSLFSDQPSVLAEFRRILKAGGALGLTDMSLQGELPSDLAQRVAPWTCLVNARSEEEYLQLFSQAGFRLTEAEDESEGLLRLIGQLKRKLVLLAAGSMLGKIEFPGLDVGEIRFWLDRFAEQVREGKIRYLRFNLVSG